MTDYIKREDAIDAVCGDCPYNCSEAPKEKHPCMEYKELMKIPSADAAPVRHGRWIEYGENKDGTHNMRCSKCGAGLKSKGHANSYYTKHKYRFCHNCGAKMDEEEKKIYGKEGE